MSAPIPPLRRRVPRLRAVVATLVLAAAACGGDTGPRPRPAGAGTVTLADRQLAVRTSFCVADDRRIALVGHGTSDEGPFVVVVRSPGLASVKFGVRAELDTPPSGSAWLTGSGTIRLRAEDGRIAGSGDLRSVTAGDDTTTRAVFDLRCNTAGVNR